MQLIPDDKSWETFLTNLQREIADFSPDTHNDVEGNEPWYRIFLAARSLWTEYYSVCIYHQTFNTTERTQITDVLNRAADILPTDIDTIYREEILRGKSALLHIPADLLTLDKEEDYF